MVFVLSDAALGRYGTDPDDLARIVSDSEQDGVDVFYLFIAEESASKWLTEALPPGRGVVCSDPADLPTAFKAMFQLAAARHAER